MKGGEVMAKDEDVKSQVDFLEKAVLLFSELDDEDKEKSINFMMDLARARGLIK